MSSGNDENIMRAALGLAKRGLGRVWPNPSVGCIITDKNGHVAGRGFTADGGRPHAETRALAMAGKAAEGGVAYVTLEPCAHHGKTPPCAEALINAGLKRVVVATQDPDARVAGRGIDMLKAAGITVDFGLCQAEADQINQGFFHKVRLKRPLVTVKLATSRDGYIAGPPGHSQWVTGIQSRKRGHLLRASHDAIMVGIGTALADNPSLDCRLPGLADRSPVRLVVDSHLRLPLDNILVTTARDIPTWVITAEPQDSVRAQRLKDQAVEIISCPVDEAGRIDLSKALALLAEKGISRLLSEGGAQLNASLIKASLVDRILWFRSTNIIGEGGIAALSGWKLAQLEEMPGFEIVARGQCGKDTWQEMKVKDRH